MNEKIDLSPEALKKRREIAEKAALGPWELEEDTIDGKNIYGIFCSSYLDKRPDEILPNERCVVLCNYVDGIEYGVLYFEDAKHIAANSPDAVIAMIDEIVLLRKQIQILAEYAEKLCYGKDCRRCKISCVGVDLHNPYSPINKERWIALSNELARYLIHDELEKDKKHDQN